MTEAEQNYDVAMLLTQPIAVLERGRRRARRVFAGLSLFTALLYIATWLYAANRLWAARQSGDWSWFWDAYKTHLGALIFLLTFFRLAQLLIATFDQALATRRGIEASDSIVAPVAPDQPRPLRMDETPKGTECFTSLFRPERSHIRPLVVPAFFFFGSAVVCLGLTALLLVFASDLALGPWLAVVALIFAGMALASAATGILMLLRARRALRPLNPDADEWGVAWDAGLVRRGWRHIAWHEARMFFRAAPGSLIGAPAMTIYVLDGGDAMLAWALSSSTTPAEQAASERLSRLIVTRTRLPLRVISAAALSPKEYDPRAPVPSPVDPPLGERAARFLRLAWLIPTVCTILITLAGLILSHLPR